MQRNATQCTATQSEQASKQPSNQSIQTNKQSSQRKYMGGQLIGANVTSEAVRLRKSVHHQISGHGLPVLLTHNATPSSQSQRFTHQISESRIQFFTGFSHKLPNGTLIRYFWDQPPANELVKLAHLTSPVDWPKKLRTVYFLPKRSSQKPTQL